MVATGASKVPMGQGCRILVVDDDPDIREGMELSLQLCGHSVITVANGHEALRCLRTQPPPGVVLLDLMMPDMNGFQLRAHMRADPALAGIPVVFVTGAGVLVEQRASELDGEVLRKPVDLCTLLEVVSRRCTGSTLN